MHRISLAQDENSSTTTRYRARSVIGRCARVVN